MATKLETEYLGRVAALGCICCTNNGYEDSPAEIHHLRDGHGVADRAPYWETLPLCPIHHRLGVGTAKTGGEIGFHAAELHYIKEYDENGMPIEPQENEWISRWEQRYGSERYLLAQIHGQLADELMDRVAKDRAAHAERIQRQGGGGMNRKQREILALGMQIGSQGQQHTHSHGAKHVTVTEKRAPTDESIRLAREYEAKAWAMVEGAVTKNIAALNCDFVVTELRCEDQSRHILFRLNGQAVTVKLDWGWERGGVDPLRLIADAIAVEITIQLHRACGGRLI